MLFNIIIGGVTLRDTQHLYHFYQCCCYIDNRSYHTYLLINAFVIIIRQTWTSYKQLCNITSALECGIKDRVVFIPADATPSTTRIIPIVFHAMVSLLKTRCALFSCLDNHIVEVLSINYYYCFRMFFFILFLTRVPDESARRNHHVTCYFK